VCIYTQVSLSMSSSTISLHFKLYIYIYYSKYVWGGSALCIRLVLRNNATQVDKVVFLTKSQQEEDSNHFKDEVTHVELELVSKMSLKDYLSENCKPMWGCRLEFVTNRSKEGSQFCRGFGGIGGLLRWKVEFPQQPQSNTSPTEEEVAQHTSPFSTVACGEGFVEGCAAEEDKDKEFW
jgi:hypothetical protein